MRGQFATTFDQVITRPARPRSARSCIAVSASTMGFTVTSPGPAPSSTSVPLRARPVAAALALGGSLFAQGPRRDGKWEVKMEMTMAGMNLPAQSVTTFRFN